MTKKQQETVLCQICKEQKRLSEVLPGELVRGSVVEMIRKTYPDWSPSGFICLADLNQFRIQYVQDVLEEGKSKLPALEDEVRQSQMEQELLSKNINIEFDRRLTFGERLSDKIAEFGGSWRFIIAFAVTLFLWIAINSVILIWRPFDPYPFIFLNLILSCLAAIQAPIIMMSQNRQEDRDRLQSEHDYQVNLKAEIEIRLLHMKIDQLLQHQWQRLLEIQQIQTELMDELTRKTLGGHGA